MRPLNRGGVSLKAISIRTSGFPPISSPSPGPNDSHVCSLLYYSGSIPVLGTSGSSPCWSVRCIFYLLMLMQPHSLHWRLHYLCLQRLLTPRPTLTIPRHITALQAMMSVILMYCIVILKEHPHQVSQSIQVAPVMSQTSGQTQESLGAVMVCICLA